MIFLKHFIEFRHTPDIIDSFVQESPPTDKLINHY